MPKRKISNRTLDTLFSLYVRARAGFRCERCGKQYKRGDQGLHASHIYSRRHHATRWDDRNAVAHCYSCHSLLGGNPLLFAEWAKEYIGEDVIEELRVLSSAPARLRDHDKREIAADLRQKLRDLGEEPPA